jgi:hypothetical protein
MPPVSVTMQPRSLLPAAAPVAVLPPAGVLDEADDVVVDDGALDELVPHAAITRLAAAAAAAAINAVLFTVSSPGPGLYRCPGLEGCPQPRLPED